MKYEPSIDRTGLVAQVRAAYGLEIEHITFIPVGYVAACYSLQCPDGQRYFLKLWPDSATGRSSAARQGIVLPLIRAMYERGIYRRVACPLMTGDNTLWASFQGNRFAIFPFLSGHHAPLSDWPVAFQDEFARTLAAIHRGTHKLADVLPPRESFALSFEHDLLASLSVIATIGPRARPGLRSLRDLMRVRGDEIRAQVERLRRWQARICTSSYPAVLCHTDMSGDNLLVDEQGHLFVLDWDEAVVASPEYDLKEAVGEHFGHVVAVYRAAGGAYPLEVDRFAFYLLRRYLEDVTARVTSILRDNTTQEQDDDDLAGIEMWGFAQWNRLDAALATVTTVLRDLQ